MNCFPFLNCFPFREQISEQISEVAIFPGLQATFQTLIGSLSIGFGVAFVFGFCNRRMGMTVVAFMAIDSIAEEVAKAVYILASSETNCLPILPLGTLNRFGFQ